MNMNFFKNKPTRQWVAASLLFLLIGGLLLYIYARTPIDDRAVVKTVFIPRGAGFFEIVGILDQAGMVKQKPLFILLTVLKGGARQMKAGEYELATSLSPCGVVNKLVRGEIKIYKVTIPEDYTLKQIADRLVAERLVTEESFFGVATDPVFLASLNIDAPSAEGYLYPDTYEFNRNMTARDIVKAMINQFRKKITPQMMDRAKERGMTTNEWVTLASLIGKETGHREEKDNVSAVFHNRLKRGMRLQSDPTAIYSLTGYQAIVRRKHLNNDTPYNTYKIMGLPPGPIANPGVDSLQAALYPAPVNYLYFVAVNDGTHKFSSTLAAHSQAVLKYQIKRKKE
jgi:UPF0755 protein